ncbi:copper amine oxidase N-terminal domain-containing protein [Bacillus horti]|uniref:Copper amine oxidase-like N-terminal domain-containing protein n=1 Tax=Caldalkalibacillus horti TaxID=77523 RepID=A0ABT9W4D5_9BACI|nr:copper amine oxidase N-terminal domain-containing protein [Bacillus horti]MDQ0167715.1 hypothetical protein [Bacillus horti]
MIKKLSLSLLASVLLIALNFSASSFAMERNSVVIDNGQLKNNRVLIPLRAVSQNLGAAVEWNQENKTIKITKAETEFVLAVNFNRARIIHPEEPWLFDVVDFDAPAELINHTTYVPLRFVSETLGARVSWDQQTKQATVALDGKQIVVNVEEPIKPTARVTDARLKQLSDKLNEANDVSSINQVRQYFKPHFTDRFINQIIQGGSDTAGYPYKVETSPNYVSSTTATFWQSFVPGNVLTGEYHYVSDRQVNLVYTGGVWKVDRVNYQLRQIRNMGLDYPWE